jgi:hypothetical protein
MAATPAAVPTTPRSNRVAPLEHEAQAVGHGEAGLSVPTGVVEHQDDTPLPPGAGLFCEQAQQRLEERFGDAVRDIPEASTRGRRNERRHVEPFEAMVAVRDRPLADRRPNPPRHRLQAEPVLVGRESLDRRIGVERGLLGDDFGDFFLNASCSAGVAAFGLRGRGFWIDQLIARSASQPRCGASEAKPSSPAIQRATLPLVQTPLSGGGSPKRARRRCRSSGVRTFAGAPLPRRRSPKAEGPNAL